MDRQSLIKELAALEAEARRRASLKLRQFFPDAGPYRRELYPKHLEFFAAGATYKERLFMAANRVGKSEAGAFEVTCHATGLYPPWWQGKRFAHPVEVWACGTTSETTRDIVQTKLDGPYTNPGTGMLPGHLVVDRARRQHGLTGALESLQVAHVSGGISLINLKTYEQGRTSFEGTAKHIIWCDEEPPSDCYTEMLYRTVTTRGIVLTTFTPLQGMSDTVKGFLEPETDLSREFKWYIQAGWDDVPHIAEDEKRALLATTPPYQIAARTKGEPSLGAGAIYPIAEADITVPTREIDPSWPRAFAMDVGWNRTAVIWGAKNPGNGQIELYDCHYQGQGEPPSHAQAIKARGAWIPGVIDPAGQGSNQVDGRSLRDIYAELGVPLEPANNAVEAGITRVWQMLVSGQLKVQAHLEPWLREFRKYHRDDKGSGKIVKKDDHLMDATRYLVMSGIERMKAPPRPAVSPAPAWGSGPMAWAG